MTERRAATAATVLLHSPLTGPAVWAHTADVLRRHLDPVLVPVLPLPLDTAPPYWQAFGRVGAAAGRAALAAADRVIIAGHSGAGLLLPAVAGALGFPERVGYLLVDSYLPEDDWSILDHWDLDRTRDLFTRVMDGLVPPWPDAALAEEVPDWQVRSTLVEELRPTPLSYFQERRPVHPRWREQRVGYLELSRHRAVVAAEAARRGMPVEVLRCGHFGPVTTPEAVARAIAALHRRMHMSASRAPEGGVHE